MSFEIVGNYQKHGYSLPSQVDNDNVPAVSGYIYRYPRDVAYGGDKWNNKTSLLTMYAGQFDDTYSTTPVPIGFDWGWNGATYNQWHLNTNGMMLFTATNASTIDANALNNGIVAHHGDLWFEPGKVNTANGYFETWYGLPSWYAVTGGAAGSYVDYFPGNFNSNSIVCENYNGFVRFRYTGTADFNPTIEILGYIDTNNVYQPQSAGPGQSGYDNYKYVVSSQSGDYSAFGNLYSFPLKAYNDGIVTNIPWSSMQKIRVKYMGGSRQNASTHALWDYNKSWVDNGVTHYYYSVVVYCSHYSNKFADASYRISLYKAGASQRFSISLVNDRTIRNNRYVSQGAKCGPYPWIASESITLGAKANWCEQSWYSENNGLTWFKYAPGGATVFSTMTQMGPPQTEWRTSNATISHINAKLDPASNYTYFYYGSNTNFPINYYDYFLTPTPNAQGYTLGIGVITAMQNILNNPGPVPQTEARVQALLNQTYSTGGKSSPTFSFKDVNVDGAFDQTDITELRSFITGRAQVNDTDTTLSYQRILVLLVENANTDGSIASFVSGNFLIPNRSRWGYAWDNQWVLPGVKGVPPIKANLSTQMYAGLGSVAKNTIVPLNGTYIANQVGATNNNDFY
jgi:hypothetical protein